VCVLFFFLCSRYKFDIKKEIHSSGSNSLGAALTQLFPYY
jgi:hypothetical protein